jgi:hypothetical protein
MADCLQAHCRKAHGIKADCLQNRGDGRGGRKAGGQGKSTIRGNADREQREAEENTGVNAAGGQREAVEKRVASYHRRKLSGFLAVLPCSGVRRNAISRVRTKTHLKRRQCTHTGAQTW